MDQDIFFTIVRAGAFFNDLFNFSNRRFNCDQRRVFVMRKI